MNKRLSNIRHAALDMDGTIYSGGTVFETTRPFLSLLRELGVGYTACHSPPPGLVVTDIAEFGAWLRAARKESFT
jgi:hypothetical protein